MIVRNITARCHQNEPFFIRAHTAWASDGELKKGTSYERMVGYQKLLC